MIIAVTVLILAVLLLLGIEIGTAMGLTGIALLVYTYGANALTVGAKVMFDSLNDMTLLTIPLFVLMGAIMMKGGIGDELFNFFDSLAGHLPGGAGIATILSCAVMAAMCGSSVGITAAIGAMAIANLRKRGYSLELSLGLPSSAGGLGALMPASVGAILYSSLTDVSVGQMLMAGLIPSLVIIALFSIYTVSSCGRSGSQSVGKKHTWAERWQAFRRAFWGLTVPVLLLMGIYGGFATVTEIAAVACFWSLIITMFIYRRLTWKDLLPTFRWGLSTGAMVMYLIATSLLLSNAITQLGVPEMIRAFFVNNSIPLWGFLAISMIILVILGTALEGAAMLLLTMPVLTPVLYAYNFDLIAYGVLFLINVELSLLSPPVGLTVQTVERIAKSLRLPITSATAWKGCIPFFILYAVAMVLVAVFPQLALWLPGTMK
jgi:C4-dicarboxylate transporter DctM subunit